MSKFKKSYIPLRVDYHTSNHGNLISTLKKRGIQVEYDRDLNRLVAKLIVKRSTNND